MTADPTAYVFRLSTAGAGSVTFAVALDDVGTDADPVDNTVRVPVS